MHTDEFEISLAREIKVCESAIKRIRKTLSLLEQKYGSTTEDFLRRQEAGTLPGATEHATEFRVWRETWESLARWEELERQYREQFRIMKI